VQYREVKFFRQQENQWQSQHQITVFMCLEPQTQRALWKANNLGGFHERPLSEETKSNRKI
jgi:hypothetical protein